MLVKIALSIGLLAPNNEVILCEVHDLASKGFEQVSEFQEYACSNIFDDMDLIIVEDEFDEFRVDDILKVELNSYGELVDYEVMEVARL